MLALGTVTLMVAASAPSPIYPIYRERWHFSVTWLTVVFAVYAVGLLAALLTVGSLSDHVGRRPVLAAAFALAAISMAMFWAADGLPMLVLARVIQGVASGTAMSGLAAGLLDLAPERRTRSGTTVTAVGTSLGMAGGAAGAGIIAALTRSPDHIVFPVLTVAFSVLTLGSLALPESVALGGARASSALRPTIRVDARARPAFRATVPTTIAGWAATGLFLALIPSLVRDVLQIRLAAAGGLTIAILYVAVSFGGIWSLRHSTRTTTILGSSLMTAGAVGLALGLAATSATAFAVGSLAMGLGVGLTFNGNLRAVGAVTDASTRSATFAAVYVLSYASLSVPTLAAGLIAPSWGLSTTGYAFIAFVALLSTGALAHALRSSGTSRGDRGAGSDGPVRRRPETSSSRAA